MSNTVVFGFHPVRVAFRKRPGDLSELYFHEAGDDRRRRALIELCEHHGVRVSYHPAAVLDNLAQGGNHQGVVAHIRSVSTDEDEWGRLVAKLAQGQARRETGDEAGPGALILVLDEVQDPHNLGACLRSAAAAGADAVVVPRRRSAGMTPTVQKVASGGAELVPLVLVGNLSRALGELRSLGVNVLGASAHGEESIFERELTGPIALVLGGEAAGLRRLTASQCDHLVTIPMPGPLESLNVSVAAGVLLFEAVRQRMTSAALMPPELASERL